MPEHVEIELKWALTPQQHGALESRLRALLGAPRELAQLNRFFDTPDRRLRAHGLNVRLRREAGGVLLTCKRRLPSRDGAHCHDEWESGLELSWWETLEQGDLASRLPLPRLVLEVLGDQPLVPLGGFANHRLEYHHQHELLCLDRTDFGVRVDHELEIETSDPAHSHAAWQARLLEWGVSVRPQGLSKFARYLALPAAPSR